MVRRMLVGVIIMSSACGVVAAGVPQLLNYQGKLANAQGQPIDGEAAVGFGFYDAETEGTLLYSEQQTVTCTNGIFHVLIGNGTVLDGDFAAISAGGNVWLEITVAGQAMSPRQRIGSVVFALKAGTIDDSSPAMQALQARLAALEQKLQAVSFDGSTLLVSGANVQIVNGMGSTNTKNTCGNLVVGYNEVRGAGATRRSGSHNIVVGPKHEYTSYGGIVAGEYNGIHGAYASVTGGFENEAEGLSSSITGGWECLATGAYSSVTGGYFSTASGLYAGVSGGYRNTASGQHSSVSGGNVNNAAGLNSSVSGGTTNLADGESSSVSGGYLRQALGPADGGGGGWWADF